MWYQWSSWDVEQRMAEGKSLAQVYAMFLSLAEARHERFHTFANFIHAYTEKRDIIRIAERILEAKDST